MCGQPGQKTGPRTVSRAWMTSHLKVALICKLLRSLRCLVYFFDMLSLGVCTSMHWHTSGRLVQESVCQMTRTLQLASHDLHAIWQKKCRKNGIPLYISKTNDANSIVHLTDQLRYDILIRIFGFGS